MSINYEGIWLQDLTLSGIALGQRLVCQIEKKVGFEFASKLRYTAFIGVFLCPEKLFYRRLYSKCCLLRPVVKSSEGICFAPQKTNAPIFLTYYPLSDMMETQCKRFTSLASFYFRYLYTLIIWSLFQILPYSTLLIYFHPSPLLSDVYPEFTQDLLLDIGKNCTLLLLLCLICRLEVK